VQHASQIAKSPRLQRIFSDRSTGFQRKNFRRRAAQKNKCVSKSNNILLSDKATINAKPQLEILLMM
jgi:Fe-S cluster assembly protein SufD